jgi:LysM domain
MDKILFVVCILCSLLVVSNRAADAGSQTWNVRAGDNLEIIATTLEIPQGEIKKLNPGVLESNLQVGQKLKLPLRSYGENKTLEEELSQRTARLEKVERKNSDLEKKLAGAKSQLRWHPIWLWGFWTCFGIIAFIVCGAYWIFRQTHPRVFDQPHDRSIKDLRQSQIRVRSSFPQEEAVPAHR